jgi:DnaJ-domain-containing protein 1
MPMVARAVYTSNGSVRLTFPFQPILIAVLKERIPRSCRTYNPKTKSWTVSGGWQDRAVNLLLGVFPDAQVEHPRSDRGTETVGQIDDAHAELHLLSSAPPELIEAAYRVLAKQHHPDAGGGTVTMQRLNTAYAVLKAQVVA